MEPKIKRMGLGVLHCGDCAIPPAKITGRKSAKLPEPECLEVGVGFF